jgi:aryl-alcohol dehydrogenase-like predicted oxidoreductase
MQTRMLGNSNLEVSALGLGCTSMSYSLATGLTSDDLREIDRGASEITVHGARPGALATNGRPLTRSRV